MPEKLSENDVKRIRNAMQRVGTSTFFTHYKLLLRAKLHVDTFLMLRFDPDAPPVFQDAWLRPNKIPPVALTEYCDRTYLFDPFFQFRAFPSTGAVYQLSDIAPDRFFSANIIWITIATLACVTKSVCWRLCQTVASRIFR